MLPAGMVPADLVALDAKAGLPPLTETEIALMFAPAASAAAAALGQHIVRSLELAA